MFWIECTNCFTNGPEAKTQAEAEKRWNQRQLVEAVELVAITPMMRKLLRYRITSYGEQIAQLTQLMEVHNREHNYVNRDAAEAERRLIRIQRTECYAVLNILGIDLRPTPEETDATDHSS